MTDHAELRRVAKAATPGARYQGTDERVIVAGNGTIICTVSGAISGPSVMADAEFLCATDPKTVLALLDEIDKLKAENDALRGAVEQLAEMLNSIHVPIDLNEILKGAKQ
ncbi:ead/Ea22-like family protein [Pseudomonas aeruginosa]|nr:ead/Ea22-like family protein [Pseudomonas aeruginosa]